MVAGNWQHVGAGNNVGSLGHVMLDQLACVLGKHWGSTGGSKGARLSDMETMAHRKHNVSLDSLGSSMKHKTARK